MDIAESGAVEQDDQDSDSSNSKPVLRPRTSKGKAKCQVSTSAQSTSSTSQSKPGSSKRKRVTGRKNLNGQDRRKAYLDKDPFAEVKNEFSVKCTACESEIKLDQRGGRAYYAQFWVKHRDTCKKIPVKQRIEMLEEDQRLSQKLPTKREKKLEQLRALYMKEQQRS
ncbi:hypothetical protein CPB83DRAFT_864587 [Crepidotus variabilis]|uniref:Uncharacterized protein n=1 Tax=Crepidotus variabilis TaxID=179855 RepID=A0A9P6E4J1_9AGAR|nr:hypothetical protein CPB83DRAFT_864587 [Crepidotus variabilis]